MGSIQNFQSGSSIFGIPGSYSGGVACAVANMPVSGNIFYVENSTLMTGADDIGTNGQSPLTPFKTINYAFTQCAANNGDVIVVGPGHTEAVKAAGGITAGVAGVTVIGVGFGTTRPSITLSTATTATVKITAANVTFKNLYFDGTGIDAVAKIFDVQAAGFCMDTCEVYFAKSGAVAIKGLVVDTAAHANNLSINNCYIHGDAAANCTNFVQLVGGDSVRITHNIIHGNFTTSLGCVNNITAALTNCLIDNNRLLNLTASSTKAVVLLTGSTGSITNNRLQILSGTAPVTADGCMWSGNYYAATIATAGTLL